MSDSFYSDGFDAFSDLLEAYEKKTEEKNVTKVLEIGAKELTELVRALPRPRSRMSAPGYTHLIDTVTYETEGNEVVVGWGKYYGPMVENGTVQMNGTPHMRPTFERNKEKIYKKMQNAIFG